MNLSWLIAKRIMRTERRSFSAFISRVAITAVALSVCVMILGSAITQGYQHEISKKFYDSWGHIHITNYLPDPSALLNDEKFVRDSVLENQLHRNTAIQSIRTYNLQSAILKTTNSMEGILLKGVEVKSMASWNSNFIVEGKGMEMNGTSYSTDIIISQTLASKLLLKVGDRCLVYAVDANDFKPKARKVTITGIYKTGLEEYDKLLVISDQRMIQHMNHEPAELIQGYEIFLQPGSNKEKTEEVIANQLQGAMEVYTIEKRFSGIFSWLGMMRTNETIIIGIMMIIACINMITALLILILERIHMIGILKSMGMPNVSIRKIFIYSSSYIVLLGVSIGVVAAVLLIVLQQKFGLIELNEASYYVKTMPVYLNMVMVLKIVGITLLCCISILGVSSFLVNKLNPIRAIRFT
jgi:lipoprotein-releasing system permease protein